MKESDACVFDNEWPYSINTLHVGWGIYWCRVLGSSMCDITHWYVWHDSSVSAGGKKVLNYTTLYNDLGQEQTDFGCWVDYLMTEHFVPKCSVMYFKPDRGRACSWCDSPRITDQRLVVVTNVFIRTEIQQAKSVCWQKDGHAATQAIAIFVTWFIRDSSAWQDSFMYMTLLICDSSMWHDSLSPPATVCMHRVAKTHRIPHLYRSFSAKEPYI